VAAAFRYAFAVLLVAAGAHIAWSTTVAGLMHAVNDHRVPNVRKVENSGTRWEDLTSAFVTQAHGGARRDGKPFMLFIGSSVTWGHPWQEQAIFTRGVAQRLGDWRVGNLSIVGVGTRGLTDFATCALGEQLRPDLLVVEIPLVNLVASATSDARHAPRVCARPGQGAEDYWQLVVRRPHGTSWMALFATEQWLARKDEELQTGPVPPGYFADRRTFAEVEAPFAAELRRFLEAVSRMGARVVVHVSPIYTAGVAEAGGDTGAVEYQIDLADRICREFAQLTCLDTRVFSGRRELFYNLTHLNQRGHRAMADWFVEQTAALRRPT
jgi:hypothetical protein